MHIARVMVCCTLLLAAGWFTKPACGQDDLGVARVGGFNGFSSALGTRWGVRADVGDGRGYDSGFTTFEAFQPITITPDQWVLWASGRGFLPYPGEWGGNVGAGIRYLDWNTGYVFGVSGWYDHDTSSLTQFQNFRQYDQVGVSFEALGPYVDLRANAYVPMNEDPRTITRTHTGFTFSGFNVLCLFDNFAESALRGGDIEIGGGFVPCLSDIGIRPYVGAYYYEGEGQETAYGAKARVEALLTQDLAFEANVTEDRIWGTHMGIAMTWRFGSGQPQRWFTRQSQVDRLYAQVERNYRVAIQRKVFKEVEVATDSSTGLPFQVFHINNTAGAGGNGTFENPLNFLPTSVPAEFGVILVDRGDGTSNNMQGGISLFDNQRFLGEGFPHQLNTGDCGVFVLAGGGNFPTISNLGGDAVTLANNNEVAGFNIVGSLGAAIRGTGISSANLHDLNISDNNQGIVLTNSGGDVFVRDVNMANNPQGGLIVDNTASPVLNLFADNVDIRGSSSAPGIGLRSDGSVILANLTNSLSEGNQTGLRAESVNGGFVDVTSVANNFNGNVGDGVTTGSGVELIADNATLNFLSTVDGISNNQRDGVTASATNLANLTATFLGGTQVNGNGRFGFNGTADNSNLNVNSLTGNTFNSNVSSGLFANLTSGAVLNLVFDDSNAISNGLHGIDLQANASTINSTITNSTLNNNVGNGINNILVNGSVLNETLLNNALTISANGQNGVFVSADASTIASFIARSNFIQSNTLAGIRFNLLNSSITSSAFTSNTITNNGSYGLVFDADTSVVNATIGGSIPEGNLFESNGDAGIALLASGAPLLPSNIDIVRNTISNTVNGSDPEGIGQGILVDLRGTGAFNINVDNNLLEGNASHGAHFFQLDNSVLTTNIRSNVIGQQTVGAPANVTGNAGNGLRFERNADAQIAAFIDDNTINQNADDGLELIMNGGGLTPLAFTVNRNIITNNQNGEHFTHTDDVDLVVNQTTNLIADNRSDGIESDGSLNGVLRGTWTELEVTRNAADGMNLDTNVGSATAGPVAIVDSSITENGDDGIQIEGSGSVNVDVTNTTISDNGNFGIDFNNDGGSPAVRNRLDLVNVTMERNANDAIELTNGNNDSHSATLTVQNSRLRFNGGRGIDVLQLVSGGGFTNRTTVDVRDSVIQGNTGTGMFIQNEASVLDTDNDLLLIALNNTISANGDRAIVLRESVSTGGLMQADIENNTFSGNSGPDLFTEAFLGNMPDPPVTTPVVTNDPLARLDLQFRNNTGDSISVNNFDDAAFNNTDALKSPVPPFLVNTRNRNAVRNTVGDLNGTGTSTFRVENDFGSNTIGGLIGFSLAVPLPPGTADESPFPYVWEQVAVGTLFP